MARDITIIAIGGKHDPDLVSAIERYEQRLRLNGGLTWRLLPYSSLADEAARRAESAAILKIINSEDYVVLLDERGSQLSSEALSVKLSDWRTLPGHITFVIGGAYGVDQTLRDRANTIMSLSSLVFPHQLVRLILVEQIYRCEMIRASHPYHHH